MAFYFDFNRIEKLTVYEAVCKVCEKYGISENDINEMDTHLTSYFYKDELTKLFNKYGFDKNRDLLQQFIVDFKELQRINKEYDENLLTRIDNNVKIYLFLTEEHTTDEKLSFFTQFFYHEVLRIEKKDENLINELNMIFTDEELHDIRVICELIKFRSTYARLLFKNIKQEDRLFVIDNYYKEVYGSAFHCLTEEEKEYLINKSKETNDIIINKRKNAYESPMEYVMALHKSNLLDKLKARYGKSYVAKTHNDINDNSLFIYTMLDSNVLKAIFENGYFDLKDTYTVNAVLCQLEDEGYDVSKIRARIERIKEELRPKELSLYNDIVFCKSDELLEKYLSQHEINRNNFSSYIRSRKFIDKKLKESILLKLCQYYKTDYISVYDLLSLVQISQETDRPLKDVLAENCIDGRRLKNIMNTLKEQQPDIYLILDKSIHGCNSIASKLIRIYNSIMKSNITDYDTFVNKYKNTPEGILELFDGNELYDSLYESLLKWYDFNGDDSQTNKPEQKKK